VTDAGRRRVLRLRPSDRRKCGRLLAADRSGSRSGPPTAPSRRRLRTLRSISAGLALRAGVPMKVVCEQLRHSLARHNSRPRHARPARAVAQARRNHRRRYGGTLGRRLRGSASRHLAYEKIDRRLPGDSRSCFCSSAAWRLCHVSRSEAPVDVVPDHLVSNGAWFCASRALHPRSGVGGLCAL
jgi:hypothetical protein